MPASFKNLFLPGELGPSPTISNVFGPSDPARNLFGSPMAESDIGTAGRLEGVFGNPEVMIPGGGIPGRTTGTFTGEPIMRGRMEELYSPENFFQEEYKRLLSQAPERKEPGILRRLGAIFAGSPEEQERFKYAGYYRDLGDFENKLKAIEPGLQAERYANTNERQLAANVMQNEAANRRISVQEQEAASREAKREADIQRDKERTAIQRNRAETYRYRTENPNNVLTEDDQGNLMAFNPQTKKIEYLLDDDGQPIKGSSLSEFDKIQLQVKGRKEVIAAQTAADLREEEIRQRNRINLERERTAGDIKVRTTPPATSKDDPNKVDTTTSTVILRDKEGKPIQSRTTTTQKSTQAGKNVGVRMRTPDGRIVLVPKDKVEEAKKKGGKVVP